jgi:hypothetical protein
LDRYALERVSWIRFVNRHVLKHFTKFSDVLITWERYLPSLLTFEIFASNTELWTFIHLLGASDFTWMVF